MKTDARVVVVGGGIFGTSVIYHLAREGWRDCVLVEKGELTSGTTWHAAGNVPHFIGSLNFARLHAYGVDLYKSLEAETGQSTGWHTSGSIRLARDAREIDWHRYVEGIARQIGFEFHMVGPEEIKKLHPFVETHQVVGGCYTPDDGHVDPTSASNALAAGARMRGAEIYRHTLVTDIRRTEGGEWLVVTDQGDIRCEHVVLATGFFSPQVGKWLGLRIPTINMVHQYLVTEAAPELLERPGELPILRDPVSSSYIRQEQKGLLGGPYETEGAQFVHEDGVPWSFDHDLLDPDLDRVAPWLDMMVERMPLFGSVGVKRVIAGFIAHAPDLSPLVGPAPAQPNVWLACGAAIGIAQGPGCGRYLAQWMVHGAAEISMLPLDPRRFGDFHLGGHVRRRTVEATEHLFEYHPPGFEFAEARGLRKTPIYPVLKEKGAVFGESFGWERPKWFGAKGAVEDWNFRRSNAFESVARECRAVRERAGLLDLGSFAKLEVRGPDAGAFLNRAFANRMPETDGGIVLAHMLSNAGTIESEATVTRYSADRYYVLSAGSAERRDEDNLRKALRQGERVDIVNLSDARGAFALTGPHSREILARLTNADLGSDAFPWLSAREIAVGGIPVHALRISYAGELGWELHHEAENTRALYDLIGEAGSESDLEDFGFYALNSLRMEKAYRGFGSELMNEVTPIEAGMARFVDFTKEFTGKEALLRRRESPPRWALAYLRIDADGRDPTGAEPVFDGETLVGSISSGAYGHAVGQALAFGYVVPGSALPGRTLSVAMLGERFPATVLDGPAYDPANARLRG